ncbi:unnamed protein product [Fraxinus pennsylvanica]|uniref:non-specific serine/threonine protein kinase n=1 Tax=Fraxinus pennsylvanica TaxID=56036 RepID=A0AAD1Z5N8_9LAMI|nr:unnamed protein product [Fraxinus pennsylvanica]
MPPRRVEETSRSMIVAVKAEKVISKTALSWAITHVARPGDCILLLAVFYEKMTGGRRFWGFPRLKGDRRGSDRNKLPDRIGQISESCSQMVLQLHGQIQVGVQIKVVSALSAGSVAAEAKRNTANWVILDKKLKRELKNCMDELQCNTVIMKGGFGVVHRGVLRNGLIIAVKRLKLAGAQREDDFCTQVRVLSCAQHRNVVLLIGFCIERKKRLLVYEYICNGSLDFHLHGEKRLTLDWHSRLKIAIGTARGLRYLHEDCRVGCIIHRDMRPNNILLTHDFEPLVADFGLATLHCEWDSSDGDQIVKTSGYLAPEYFNGGNMTEKVDVYAFGVVLLELITGERAGDLLYCIDRQLFLDNFHPSSAIEPIQRMHMLSYKHQLLDSCLASYQIQSLPYEIQAMGYAASLCLQQNPELRPPMSKVLRILEGGSAVTPQSLDLNSVGSRSGHMEGMNSKKQLESKMRHSRRLSY